jgi:hypothetical protein
MDVSGCRLPNFKDFGRKIRAVGPWMTFGCPRYPKCGGVPMGGCRGVGKRRRGSQGVQGCSGDRSDRFEPIQKVLEGQGQKIGNIVFSSQESKSRVLENPCRYQKKSVRLPYGVVLH